MSHFRVILPFQGQFRTVLSIAGSQSIGLSDDFKYDNIVDQYERANETLPPFPEKREKTAPALR